MMRGQLDASHIGIALQNSHGRLLRVVFDLGQIASGYTQHRAHLRSRVIENETYSPQGSTDHLVLVSLNVHECQAGLYQNRSSTRKQALSWPATILIIATSRSALFKIKRATRARSETRLPCRSSPFVSVLPVVGPQIPMNRSLPPRTTMLFREASQRRERVHKKRLPGSMRSALPSAGAGRCCEAVAGAKPHGRQRRPNGWEPTRHR